MHSLAGGYDQLKIAWNIEKQFPYRATKIIVICISFFHWLSEPIFKDYTILETSW